MLFLKHQIIDNFRFAHNRFHLDYWYKYLHHILLCLDCYRKFRRFEGHIFQKVLVAILTHTISSLNMSYNTLVKYFSFNSLSLTKTVYLRNLENKKGAVYLQITY